MKRIQRANPIGTDIRRVDAKPSASVPGALGVIAYPPPKQRAFLRSAHHAGAATAGVYGGPVSERPSWSGPNGPSAGPERGSKRISVDAPSRK